MCQILRCGMKATSVILALALASLASGAPDPTPPAAATDARIAALKEAFRFAPIATPVAALPASSDDVLVLEQLTITESMSRRALAEQIRRRWEADRLLEFSWDKGGLLFVRRFGGADAEFGVWVSLEERRSGITSAKPLALRLDLVRMRW
jgi:hypothetical protein